MSLLELFFSFKGRIGRRDFWTAYIIVFIIYIIAVTWIYMHKPVSADVLLVIAHLLIYIPTLALCSKRFHDRGRSAWWILLGLIPFCGHPMMLFDLAMPGGKFRNQYGTRRDVSLFPARARAAKTLAGVLKGLKKTGDESELENDLARLSDFNDVLKLIAIFVSESKGSKVETDGQIVRFLTERLEYSGNLAARALSILKEAGISEFTAEYLARSVFERFEYDTGFLGELATLLIEIAKADGELNEHEVALLNIVFDNLDISSEYLDGVESLSTIYP